MRVKTTDGDLIVTADGVAHEPFTLGGTQPREAWTWAQIGHLAFEDVGRKTVRGAAGFGFLGLLARSRQSVAVLSVGEDDIVFAIPEPIELVRAAARRLEGVPAGKVSVG